MRSFALAVALFWVSTTDLVRATKIYEHEDEELYTADARDCGRGLIATEANAAGLPIDNDAFAVSIDFKGDDSPAGGYQFWEDDDRFLWSYGDATGASNAFLGLSLHYEDEIEEREFRLHYGAGALDPVNFGSGEYRSISISRALSPNFYTDYGQCDNTWHTILVESQGNGAQPTFTVDGTVIPTSSPHGNWYPGDGTIASSSSGFCLGGTHYANTSPFRTDEQYVWKGALRNLHISTPPPPEPEPPPQPIPQFTKVGGEGGGESGGESGGR